MSTNSKTADPEFNEDAPVKERPMILSGSEVSGILAGARSQLRRPVRLSARAAAALADRDDSPVLTDEGPGRFRWAPRLSAPERFKWAPYGERMPEAWRLDANENHGVPGDRLWVRETWAAQHDLDVYKPREIKSETARLHYAASEDLGGLLVRASVAMPRWASRLTLKITEVRVQRLRSISEADARAEGYSHGCGPSIPGLPLNAVDAYEQEWARTKQSRAMWEENPWMWVITFSSKGCDAVMAEREPRFMEHGLERL